jgi:hypothetical protein
MPKTKTDYRGTMKQAIIQRLRIIASILSVLILGLSYAPVYAAALTSLSDTMTRAKDSSGGNVLSNHTVKFTLGAATALNAGETIIVDFDSGFDLTGFANTEVEDFDIVVATAEESIVAAGGCASNDAIEITAVNNTDKSFTFTACSSYTAEAVGSVITIEIGTHASSGGTGNDQVINPSTTGTKLINITAAGDTGQIAVVIVANDQVVLTATVDPSITFSVSDSSSTFTTSLSAGIVRTAATVITLTVGTNGNGGYSISVRDIGNTTNPGLYNSLASAIIGSANGSYAATADLGDIGTTFGYGMQAACTAGCTTNTHVNSDYRQGTDVVGAFTIADKNVATYTSSTSTSHTITNTYKAKASASTKAGTYTDTLTYVATATF